MRSRRRTRCSRSGATTPAACSTWCSPRACGRPSRTSRPTPLVVKDGATDPRRPTWRPCRPGAPDRTTLDQRRRRVVAANISVSQQVGANILDVRAGVEAALTDLAQTLPAGLKLSKTYDLAEFVATAIANVRDAILDRQRPRGDRPARVPARLAPDAGRLGHAAAHRHDDVPGHALARRDDQRHVDGRPRGRHRPGHRRRGRRGREHLPASRQGRDTRRRPSSSR